MIRNGFTQQKHCYNGPHKLSQFLSKRQIMYLCSYAQ